MEEKRTSLYENGLVWFGAAVSVAEILTGTSLAPLGLSRGLAAVVLGHLIGCMLLFLAGLIGGRTRKSAMQTAALSFGSRGALLFAVLNLVQLVGWTAIMIYDGALAADGVWALGAPVWCVVIGGLVVVWIRIGLTGLGRLNTVSMAALLVLTAVLGWVTFRSEGEPAAGEALSFGAAVELSAAMPLSWLPLISDYTRTAEKPAQASLVSTAVYGTVSCYMYIIGLGAALFAGTSDIAQIMASAGLGAAALVIIVLSTVTTTFLDAYSAGITGEVLLPGRQGTRIATAAAVLGTLGAVCFPMDDVTGFLYLIGSVFAPMAAILITDHFLLRTSHEAEGVCISRLVIWALGFAAYRLLMRVDSPVGSTLPDMAVTAGMCLAWEGVKRLTGRKKGGI